MSEQQTPQFKFFVYIVESPSDVDLYRGRNEGETLQLGLRLADVPVTRRLVISKAALTAALTTGIDELLSAFGDRAPVVHLSAHGDKTGVQLSSGEIVTWAELCHLLVPLNKAAGGNLVLCMSTCEGIAACRMAMKTDPELPFYGVVGTCSRPTWSEGLVAYMTFYFRLSHDSSVVQAVEAMRAASGHNQFGALLGSHAQAVFLQELQATTASIRQLAAPPDSAHEEDESTPNEKRASTATMVH